MRFIFFSTDTYCCSADTYLLCLNRLSNGDILHPFKVAALTVQHRVAPRVIFFPFSHKLSQSYANLVYACVFQPVTVPVSI